MNFVFSATCPFCSKPLPAFLMQRHLDQCPVVVKLTRDAEAFEAASARMWDAIHEQLHADCERDTAHAFSDWIDRYLDVSPLSDDDADSWEPPF